MPKIVFYARVSTRDQNPNGQLDAASRLGVKPEHIFVETASGVRHDRPVLGKTLAALEEGDTLAAFKFDHVECSLAPGQGARRTRRPRVHFQTTEDGLSTNGSTGKLVLRMLAVIAISSEVWCWSARAPALQPVAECPVTVDDAPGREAWTRPAGELPADEMARCLASVAGHPFATVERRTWQRLAPRRVFATN